MAFLKRAKVVARSKAKPDGSSPTLIAAKRTRPSPPAASALARARRMQGARGSFPTTSQKPASYQDLSASCFLALVLLGLIHWDNPALNVLRVVVGLVVGLVLPGYTLLGVLCPRKSQLDGLERWGLSMVLSAIVVIVAAWALSVAGIRLSTTNIVAALAWIILFFTGAAAVRRGNLPPEQVFVVRPLRGPLPGIVLGIAALLAATTWMVTGTDLGTVQPEFYITTRAGHLSGYPFQIPVGTHYAVELHVGNPTPQPLGYHLVISDDQRRLADRPVHVRAHGAWSMSVVLPNAAPPRSEVVAFTLYDASKAMRKLWIRYRIAP